MNSTMKTPAKRKALKRRITAFWLVIILGPGEWFFNLKKNKKKLLIGLPIAIVSFVTIMFFIIPIYSDLELALEASPSTVEEIKRFSDLNLSGPRIFYHAIIPFIGIISVYLWAVIDVFSRSDSWYENQPN